MQWLQWIHRYATKLDPLMRRRLILAHKPLRRVPCILHRAVRRLLHAWVRIPVIVQFKGMPGERPAERLVQATGVRRRRLGHEFTACRGVSARLSVREIRKLLEDDAVERITYDRPVKALLDIAGPAVGADKGQRDGFTGKGVTIAIVDTGIHPHPDLTEPVNRIAAFQDFVNNRTEPYDDNGHGTHCAGDAAGNGLRSGGRFRGPAPEARLVGVKVLDRTGSGSLSTVIRGVEWVIREKDTYGIRVLSLSLGSSPAGPPEEDPLVQAVEAAWKAGIVVVAAAGNEGPQSGTISSPGDSALILTVGAADDHRTVPQEDDVVASFSSRGPTPSGLPKPDLVAPGVGIISLRAPGSFLDKVMKSSRVGTDYFQMSGTSMAAPIVAGAVALLLEKNPQWTPDQVKSALMRAAFDLNETPEAQGSGEIQLASLV
ncbi:MAG: S8 family peptidase [Alicyclobacillaceae bacterium]|nr:S8 family peptidase [Alicyclobacillaceae bacterium]